MKEIFDGFRQTVYDIALKFAHTSSNIQEVLKFQFTPTIDDDALCSDG